MDRRSAIRFVRIAASALCLMVCGLLTVLWVRSYHQSDWIYMFRTSDWHHLWSINGSLVLQEIRQPSSFQKWGVASAPVSEFSDSPYGWNTNIVRPQHALWGFAMFTSPKVNAFAMPYWFLVLLSATLGTLAAAPWIRWRFSLRTMLIVTALIAVLLGLIVVFAR